MTWVVGANTPFGYGVMVSDVCVTLPDGTRRDVLRKSYPVGRFLVAGFAGSVAIGMHLIDSLRDFLRMSPEETTENFAWQPEWVAQNFSSQARAIFEQYIPKKPAHETHLMLVGVQPVENLLGGGQSIVAVLRSPLFEPEVQAGGGHVMSIGSGSQEKEAMETLAAQVCDFGLMKAEVMNPGGFGRMIAFGMTRDLFFGAPDGVSRHMHVTVVNASGFSSMPNDVEYHPREGESLVLKMPPVAESLSELEQMLNVSSDSALGMRAIAAGSLSCERTAV